MAVVLDGSDYLSRTQADVATPPATLAGWCRIDAGVNGYLATISSADGNSLMGLLCKGSVTKCIANVRVAGEWNESVGDPWRVNEWQHLAAVFHASGLVELYQDGIVTASSVLLPKPSGLDHVTIGGRLPGEVLLSGSVAGIGVWSTALAAEDVRTLSGRNSPLTLANRLGDLCVFHDFVTSGEGSLIGGAFTSAGALASAPHPPLLYPSGPLAAGIARVVNARIARSQCVVAGSERSTVIIPGAEAAAAYPFAEPLYVQEGS